MCACCLRISVCMSDVSNIILLYLTMYYMTFSTYIWGALYVQNKNTVYTVHTYICTYILSCKELHTVLQRTAFLRHIHLNVLQIWDCVPVVHILHISVHMQF